MSYNKTIVQMNENEATTFTEYSIFLAIASIHEIVRNKSLRDNIKRLMPFLTDRLVNTHCHFSTKAVAV